MHHEQHDHNPCVRARAGLAAARDSGAADGHSNRADSRLEAIEGRVATLEAELAVLRRRLDAKVRSLATRCNMHMLIRRMRLVPLSSPPPCDGGRITHQRPPTRSLGGADYLLRCTSPAFSCFERCRRGMCRVRRFRRSRR